MAKRPIWSGSISFGLVNVPVKLFGAVEQKAIHFNMLHDKDQGRIQLKRFCSMDGEEVAFEHIVKGYEVSKNQYVVVSPEELKRFETKMSRVIEIRDFVDLAEIDPVYFESTYYLVPELNAQKAFRLLSEAMKRAGKVGIAHIVMRTRMSLCAVRPTEGGLTLSTMNAADEVVPLSSLEKDSGSMPAPSDRELEMAEQLIGQLSTGFEPEKYRDEYREQLMDFIQKKVDGQEVVGSAASEEPLAPVVSLMEALKKSLAASPKGRPTAEGTRRHRSEAARTAKLPKRGAAAR